MSPSVQCQHMHLSLKFRVGRCSLAAWASPRFTSLRFPNSELLWLSRDMPHLAAELFRPIPIPNPSLSPNSYPVGSKSSSIRKLVKFEYFETSQIGSNDSKPNKVQYTLCGTCPHGPRTRPKTRELSNRPKGDRPPLPLASWSTQWIRSPPSTP